MKLHPIWLGISLLCIAGQAFSDTAKATQNTTKKTTKEEKSNVSGGAKLGLIYSKDTDSSTSLNSGVWFTYQPNTTAHTFKAYTYYTNSTDDDDGVNKYNLSYKFTKELDETNNYFITNEYQHDQTATYRHKYILTTGLEHKIYDLKNITLTVGGGPGYRYTKRQATDDDYPNQEEHDVIANGYLEGKKVLSDSLSVSGSGNVDYGESDTTYTLDANLTNKLVGNVALAFDTKYIYDTEASSSTSHDEIYSTMSITYAF